MNHLIIGYGEIGNAVGRALGSDSERFNTVDWVDKDRSKISGLPAYDSVHVALPYTDSFTTTLVEYSKKFHAPIWFIHSTVKPGTCRALAQLLEKELIHYPIRGKHPDLYSGVLYFQPLLGTQEKTLSALAKKIVLEMQWSSPVKTNEMVNYEDSEYAKLCSLCYYFVTIFYMQKLHEVFVQEGVSFGSAYTKFTKQYNDGWALLDSFQFTRPVLDYQHGPIGGHCVVPGVEILRDHLSSSDHPHVIEFVSFLNMLLAHDKRRRHEVSQV